jgi:hypothetical protein
MSAHRLLCTFAVCLTASICWAQKDDEANPREKLSTAIPYAIKLMEKKEFETVLEQFVPPDELKKITEKKPMADFAKEFGQHHSPRLLKVLKTIKDAEPTYDETGKIAVYQLKAPDEGNKDIKFIKIDKFWYIKN